MKELLVGFVSVVGIVAAIGFSMYACERWAFARVLAIIGGVTLLGWMFYVAGDAILRHP